jgi:hypothetical protein
MRKIVFPVYPVGYRYGNRTIVSEEKKRNHVYGYDIQCDCGQISFIPRNVVFGNSRAKICVYCRKKKTTKAVPVKRSSDYPNYPIGYKYHSRTIISDLKKKGLQWGYDVQCDCGSKGFLRRNVINNKVSAGDCIHCYRKKRYKGNLEVFSLSSLETELKESITMNWHSIHDEKPPLGTYCLFSDKYMTCFRILQVYDRFPMDSHHWLIDKDGDEQSELLYWWIALKDINLSDTQKKQLNIETRYNDLQNKLAEIQKEMRYIKPDCA